MESRTWKSPEPECISTGRAHRRMGETGKRARGGWRGEARLGLVCFVLQEARGRSGQLLKGGRGKYKETRKKGWRGDVCCDPRPTCAGDSVKTRTALQASGAGPGVPSHGTCERGFGAEGKQKGSSLFQLHLFGRRRFLPNIHSLLPYQGTTVRCPDTRGHLPASLAARSSHVTRL